MKINNFRGDLTDNSAEKEALIVVTCFLVGRPAQAVATCRSVLLLSKLNKMFFGYFDPVNILLDNKNK